ncbi:hypothetical protein QZH41_015638 [Actinostola sp. cb2023]|nr:hypothetical protein QZH41_015638 [Actinostola sp. cb2023]
MPRDPYPFPKLQNDTDFAGSQADQVVDSAKGPTDTSSQSAPWNRLYKTPTLSSARREVCHYDPKAPRDSLDFVIKSAYDHHQEFLNSNAETLFQPETLGAPHGRILKNRPPPPEPPIDIYKLSIMRSTAVKRESIHSNNGAVESHHSAATNGGYSRKHDGGCYTC